MVSLLTSLQRWLHKRIIRSKTVFERTVYSFDGQTVVLDDPVDGKSSVEVKDLIEIGIETTDWGPFIEDVFWLLTTDTVHVRIPQLSPVFTDLMNHFKSYPGFNWEGFAKAMSCTDNHYFLCWKKTLNDRACS